ncbi:MAG: RNA methyltransferase, partial [Ilumatobacteraceae bacterium]
LVDPDRVPAIARRLGVVVYAAGPDVRRAVTGMGRVQPVVAVFERPRSRTVTEVTASASRIVVVEAVDNPANVGAIVRNAAALGWDGLVLDGGSADPLARRSLRVAMGTAFALPHARTDDLVAAVAELGRQGVATFALTPDDGARDVDDVRAPARCAIVVGAERAGLSPEMLAACWERVRIPLVADVDSLNVAAATAIACHALRRR